MMIDLSDYVVLLKDALQRKEVVVFGCCCTLTVFGKKGGFLDLGDRVVMISKDGGVMVVQPQGEGPVAMLPPNTVCEVFYEKGKMMVKAEHIGEKQRAEISIGVLYFFHSYQMYDAHQYAEQEMHGDHRQRRLYSFLE